MNVHSLQTDNADADPKSVVVTTNNCIEVNIHTYMK